MTDLAITCLIGLGCGTFTFIGLVCVWALWQPEISFKDDKCWCQPEED